MFQGAFDSMFGESAMDVESVDVKMLPLTINKPLLKKILETAENEKKWVLMFVIGTKPCFYKFYGSIQAALKHDLPFFILNAEQHYDAILTYGLKELNRCKPVNSGRPCPKVCRTVPKDELYCGIPKEIISQSCCCSSRFRRYDIDWNCSPCLDIHAG